MQDTRNLVRVFERQIVQTLRASDRILRSLQMSAVNETLLRDFEHLVAETDRTSDFTAQVAITDAAGRLIASSLGPVAENAADLSDREHFRVHHNSENDVLFISKPVLGRLSGQWSVQMTRRYLKPRGGFGGVIVVSLSSKKLSDLFASVDLGADGAISLTGFDGVVRAAAGYRNERVGLAMPASQLIQRSRFANEGVFVTDGLGDRVRRILSYAVVDGFPLIVSVGRAEHQVLAGYAHRKVAYRSVAAALTLFILLVIALSARHRIRLMQARDELRASEALAHEKSRELELTLDHMSQGIMMIDADNTVAVVNRRAVELLELPESVYARPKFADLMAHHLARGEYGKNGQMTDPRIWEAVKSGSLTGISTYERTRPNGVTLDVRTTPLPGGGVVRTFTDVSERKRNEEKIAHMALHDALTGLANRVLLGRHIEAAFAQQRRHGESFALLLVDLDRFKQVNDTLGHAAGDALLRHVAERLRMCVGGRDVAARLGGDEFAILCAGAGSRAGIEVLAQRVVDAVSAPYDLDGSTVDIGASVGVARSSDCADRAKLFRNADLALYRVKSDGRNGFRLFEAEMDAQAQARRQAEVDLRGALGNGEFEINYQPIVTLATGKVCGAEALLRWNHPRRGRIAPADFMPLAEEIGLMTSIDAWVLETACREAAAWPDDIVVAVNLSPAPLARRNLLEIVRQALSGSGLAPRRLELEISEHMVLREQDENVAIMRELCALGARLALDDFGTGLSSLSDLRAFPFDKIKIDRTFVTDIERRADCRAIVAALAGLGRAIGTDTTAEGVETKGQAELVRAAGCTQAQGYLFSRPLGAAAMAALLGAKSQAVA